MTTEGNNKKRRNEFADRPWLYRQWLAANTRKPRTIHELLACGGISRVELCQWMEDHPQDIDRRDSFGRTPSMLCGHSAYLDLLLEKGADPLALDHAGNNLLMYHWPHGNKGSLLDLGVDINSKNYNGCSLFSFAVKNDWDVSELLACGAHWEDIPETDVDAFFKNNIIREDKFVLSRLTRDSLPTQKVFTASRIWTAIHSQDMFIWLGRFLNRYAKTTVRKLWDAQKNDILETFRLHGCDGLYNILSCVDSDRDLREIIASTNNPKSTLLKGDMPSDQLELLLELGADPNLGVVWKMDTDIQPPLFDAVHTCNAVNTRILLDHGADPSTGTSYMDTDMTCLVSSIASNSMVIFKMLLEAGADPNLSLRGNRTPLVTAIQCNRLEMVKALLAAGADPDLTYEKDRKPSDYFDILHRDPVIPEIRELILAAETKGVYHFRKLYPRGGSNS